MECIKEQYEFDNYSLEVERIKLSIVTDLCFYNGHPFHMAHGEWNKVVQHAAAEYTKVSPDWICAVTSRFTSFSIASAQISHISNLEIL